MNNSVKLVNARSPVLVTMLPWLMPSDVRLVSDCTAVSLMLVNVILSDVSMHMRDIAVLMSLVNGTCVIVHVSDRRYFSDDRHMPVTAVLLSNVNACSAVYVDILASVISGHFSSLSDVRAMPMMSASLTILLLTIARLVIVVIVLGAAHGLAVRSVNFPSDNLSYPCATHLSSAKIRSVVLVIGAVRRRSGGPYTYNCSSGMCATDMS